MMEIRRSHEQDGIAVNQTSSKSGKSTLIALLFELKRQSKTFICFCIVIVSGLVLAISIAGFFPSLHWQVELFCNLRPQFALFGLLSLFYFLRQKHWFMLVIPLLILLVNVWALAPFFIKPRPSAGAPVMVVTHLNTNRGKAELSDLNDLSTDLLLLQEVTPRLNKNLPDIFPAYNVAHSYPLTNTHGSAVLLKKGSAVTISKSEIIHCPESSERPLIAAKVKVGDRSIRVLSLHLTRPLNPRTDRYQKVELDAVAEWSQGIQQNENEAVLIIGDFNATPWSHRYHRLLLRAKLNDSLQGYGLQNTWPTNLPPLLGIPIDHAVHSRGLVSTQRSASVIRGTDHALLQVELALRDD